MENNNQVKEKRNYTITDKVKQSIENNIKHVTGCNEQFWNDFEQNSGKAEMSLRQYKSATRRFIEYIQDKSILETTITELQNYLTENFEEGNTRNNQERYITSFLVYTISNNMETAINSTSSDLILNLIPSEYKNLIKVLMNK